MSMINERLAMLIDIPAFSFSGEYGKQGFAFEKGGRQ